jgi:hypothetical protein
MRSTTTNTIEPTSISGVEIPDGKLAVEIPDGKPAQEVTELVRDTGPSLLFTFIA